VSAPSDTRLLVLHGLRLKGFAEADTIATLVDVEVAIVGSHLEVLHADGLVLRRDGRLSGWTLTPAGRDEHARAVTLELGEAGCQVDVVDAYNRFLALNRELLAVCTAWQLIDETTMNDHSDSAYDAAVIERLGKLNDELSPILDDLEATLGRFRGYRERFDNALARVRAGEIDWFAKPMIDSYHTVWFELHEDLLATLGLERSKEAHG
jgi:hypothetical protein